MVELRQQYGLVFFKQCPVTGDVVTYSTVCRLSVCTSPLAVSVCTLMMVHLFNSTACFVNLFCSVDDLKHCGTVFCYLWHVDKPVIDEIVCATRLL